jgi:pimeloyl-ACP methyl ester carboxylesterase
MSMRTAPVGDVDLAYEVRGAGEPVLLVHGGVCADLFRGLLAEPRLATGRRLIHYHRVGYGGSGRIDGEVTLRQQAAHCRALLRQLGVDRAHVVGHSSGASIALQLALDHPAAVRSLALLETALLAVPTGEFAAVAMRHHRDGDRAAAVPTWLGGVAGPHYRIALDRLLPSAFDQAVADADTFFGQELPAVRRWSFGPEDAARVGQPVLAVLGAGSDEVSPAFGRRHDLLLRWLPAAESYVLPGATHLMPVQNPVGLAEALAHFLGEHGLGEPGRRPRRCAS